MVVNLETYNRSDCKELRPVACSTTNETTTSHSLPPGSEAVKEEGKERILRMRGQAEPGQCLLDRTGLLDP